MADELTKQEQYMLKELENASQLTYHIDELRNKLTGFFLTFTGIAVTGLTLLLKVESQADGSNSAARAPEVFAANHAVAVLMLVIGGLGVAVIGILAKLRSVQLEHFRIINNIRTFFLGADKRLWGVVELSEKTLPLPDRQSFIEKRSSGTYLWLLMIMLVTAFIFAASNYLFLVGVYHLMSPEPAYWVSVVLLCAVLIAEDVFYFHFAKPRAPVVAAPASQS